MRKPLTTGQKAARYDRFLEQARERRNRPQPIYTADELKIEIFANNNRNILWQLLCLNTKHKEAGDTKALNDIFQELAEVARNLNLNFE